MTLLKEVAFEPPEVLNGASWAEMQEQSIPGTRTSKHEAQALESALHAEETGQTRRRAGGGRVPEGSRVPTGRAGLRLSGGSHRGLEQRLGLN